MKRKILGTTIACVLIGGCATSAPNVFENGSRSPAPPNERLVSLNAIMMEKQEREAERSGLMQKIKELGNELADVKGRLQTQATPPDTVIPLPSATTDAKPAPATQGDPGEKKRSRIARSRPRNPAMVGSSRETLERIVIQDTGMVFRVTHGYARTDFRPSKSLQQQLLQAARAGKRVEIRGRTDAAHANPVDRQIALERALNARVFLANNGIHPRKMQVNYMAAGDNVASNTTADGRARNRRVEIETVGIQPDVLEDLAAVIRNDLQ